MSIVAAPSNGAPRSVAKVATHNVNTQAQSRTIQRETVAGSAPIDSFVEQLPRSRPVVVVVGSAGRLENGGSNATLRDPIDLFIRQAIVPIVRENDAVVVTGGTNSGVMHLTGLAFHDLAPNVRLVGIHPTGPIPSTTEGAPPITPESEPSHTDLLIVQGTRYGCERSTLYRVAESIADGSPIIMIVLGGGDETSHEVEGALERGWIVISVLGSGRFAETLRPSWESKANWQHVTPFGPYTRDRIAATRLGDPEDLRRLVSWVLCTQPAVKDAWHACGICDRAANENKPRARRMQKAMLTASVLTVALDAITDTMPGPAGVLPVATALIAALAGALAAWSAKREHGRRWAASRAAAEQCKRAIFEYRIGSAQHDNTRLTEKVTAALGDLRASGANVVVPVAGVWPSEAVWTSMADGDDGIQTLTIVDYLRFRVANQLSYFAGTVSRDRRRFSRLTFLIVLTASGMTLLAALGEGDLRNLIAVVAMLQASFSSWLIYDQADERVAQMSAAAEALRDIHARSSPSDLSEPTGNCWVDESNPGPSPDKVVAACEAVLATENAQWAQALRLARESLGTLQPSPS